MTSPALAPWIERPFGLVSLREIIAAMTDQDEWPTNELILGPLANALYGIGRVESGRLSPTDTIGVAVMLENAADSLSGWGFAATAGAFRDLAEMIQAHVTQGATHLYGPERVPLFAALARNTLMRELEALVFLPIRPGESRYYREPLRGWQEVLERFPGALSDIEEAGKCFALARYPASVFHCMQVMEHGLLALGEFMQIADPKSGFTAVANALQRIKDKKYPDLTDFEKEHFAFFEQMHGSIQAAKDSWRNKINHAQGAPRLMTADFSEAVALEIYMATRGFMRRLATEMPRPRKRRWPL